MVYDNDVPIKQRQHDTHLFILYRLILGNMFSLLMYLFLELK